MVIHQAFEQYLKKVSGVASSTTTADDNYVELLKIDCRPTPHTSEKNPQGINPVNRYRPYVVIPDGLPTGAFAPNSTPNTNV